MTPTTPPLDWEPQLWDDHGQPLCATQAEENEMIEELIQDGILGTEQPIRPQLNEMRPDAF
jgi:hypothetical protein